MGKNWANFKFDNTDFMVLTERQEMAKNGRSWDITETDKRIFTPEQYTNFVTAAPWFNRVFRYDFNGNRTKAICTIKCGYTCAGYLPTSSDNIAPDGMKKTHTKLNILYKKGMLDKAGYRERDILSRAKTWDYDWANGMEVYTFYASDPAGQYENLYASFSITKNCWIG